MKNVLVAGVLIIEFREYQFQKLLVYHLSIKEYTEDRREVPALLIACLY